MRFAVASLVAFVGIASAASGCSQAPVGDTPSGNPIAAPGLGQVVPAGTPFTITWNPTTAGTVSIVLLRGPSTNVVPIGCLADNLPNSGKFVWTPSSTLTPDTTHYGLQIIVTETGQYQYSTQFGISNPLGSVTSKVAAVSQISDGQIQAPGSTSAAGSTSAISTSASVVSTSAAAVSTSASSSANTTAVVSSVKLPTIIPSIAPINSANATKTTSVLVSTVTPPSQPPVPVSTGLLPNSSIIQPTNSMSVPATLLTSSTAGATATKASTPAATGAATKTLAGVMLAGLGMVAALLL